jgi:class 3 adenylate cyclase
MDGSRLTTTRPDYGVAQMVMRLWRCVRVLGDGFLATFDAPARAIHCAQSIIIALRPFGIPIRAGIHTGEVEIVEDDIRGIAVHITSRVASLGGTDDIAVSRRFRHARSQGRARRLADLPGAHLTRAAF